MKTIPLTNDRIKDFRNYYRKFSREQDESYPPQEDYTVREDEPVYLLVDDKGRISGAAALMLHKEYLEAGDARFRMFHCKDSNAEGYKILLDRILEHTHGLNSIYCFIEDRYSDTGAVWKQMGFTPRRYSWVLSRGLEGITEPEFPGEYELKSFREGVDENSWCEIINEAFGNSLGHVRMHPEKITDARKDPSYIKSGVKMLWHNDKPVGTVAMIKEEINGEEVIFIEAIALRNAYQGKGLGKNILRSGVKFAKDFGAKHAMLSVNAENEKAAGMYFKEGFKKEEMFTCYHYIVNNNES